MVETGNYSATCEARRVMLLHKNSTGCWKHYPFYLEARGGSPRLHLEESEFTDRTEKGSKGTVNRGADGVSRVPVGNLMVIRAREKLDKGCIRDGGGQKTGKLGWGQTAKGLP